MTLDHRRLLIKTARLYYERNLTQSEISAALRLSRQKVQRLLRQARAEGVVRITINPIVGIYADLERGLEERYGLYEAVVVEASAYDDPEVAAREVGTAAAGYLLRIVQPRDRIVISWGGTLHELVTALDHNPADAQPELEVVQGLGGLVEPNNGAHAADLTRRLAAALGGVATLLPAPGVVGTAAARIAFAQDPYVLDGLRHARSATLAIMGIGVPRHDSVLVRDGTIVRWPELAALAARGAVGDINLRYFDAQGQPISSELDERVIGLNLDELRRIDRVVGVAGGAVKFEAIRAALRGHLVNTLVTDHETARRLLRSS